MSDKNMQTKMEWSLVTPVGTATTGSDSTTGITFRGYTNMFGGI